MTETNETNHSFCCYIVCPNCRSKSITLIAHPDNTPSGWCWNCRTAWEIVPRKPETQTDKDDCQTSEFGMGLAYCLGLFLAHADRDRKYAERPEFWFEGATDHLIDLQCDAAPESLRQRLEQLRDKCVDWRPYCKTQPTKNDIAWAIQEAKELLRLIDEANGVKTLKGEWE